MSHYKPYPAYKDSGVAWLGQVPKHWTIGPYKALIQIENGSDYKEVEADDGYPVIGSGGPFACSSSRMYEGESVLLGRKGTIDKPLYVNGAFWAVDTMYWSIIKPEAHGRFAYYIATIIPFDMYSTNTALPSMTKSVLSSHIVAFPRFEEQQVIATHLDRETARIDALMEKKTRFIGLLREKRQALITYAVTKGLDPKVKMKNSGVEWLGEVPEHWSVLKVGRHAMVMTGFTFSSEGFTQDESKVRLLRGINIGVSSLRWDATVYWERKSDDRLEAYELSAGTIVLGMDRPWISEGMRIAIVQPEDLPCLLLQRVASITTDSLLYREYLYLVLSSELFKAGLQPDMTGLSVPHISAEQITGFRIALPPVSEQRAICNHVYEELERMDLLIQRTDRSIALLKERRAALITAAVTGQIDLREAV